jgi:hypothetical protein
MALAATPVALPVRRRSRTLCGMSQPSFALFVSCVEGSLVMRYGTRTFIGAERRALEPTVIDYHPDIIVAIPHDEFRKYRREYLRALRDGSLASRTEQAWREQSRQEPPTEQRGAGTPRAPNDAPE